MPAVDPYFTYRRFMEERYGHVLHRVPIDLGFGCPHRGEERGGCTFCPSDGGRSEQTISAGSVAEQVEMAVSFARRRYGARHFLAYFQAHTSTFASTASLRESIEPVLAQHPFEAVSIGTRPDCLTEETLGFMGILASRYDLWIELGVQTTHNSTLERIHRGHDWECSKRAIRRLHERGISVAAHLILGLPGESDEDMRATAKRLSDEPISALKLHNLHVIRDTPLAEEYEANPFLTDDEYEYAERVMDFLRRLRPDLPIMRLTTDTPECELIAPRWHLSKASFLAMVNDQMVRREWRQGDLTGDQGETSMASGPFETSPTDDGSATFWSDEYREHFHAKVGARREAIAKFVEPAGIAALAGRGAVRILDVCFGLGYNTFAAVDAVLDSDKGNIEVTALEMDRRVVRCAASTVVAEDADRVPRAKALTSLHASGRYSSPGVKIEMLWGDARFRVRGQKPQSYDAIFLDPFSTQRNAELWTVDFFRRLRELLKPSGVLVTYGAAIPVRAGLLEAGFHVGETPAVGRSRGGTIASIDPDRIQHPLPDEDLRLIRCTPRGTPCRDPHQIDSNGEILHRRQQEMRGCICRSGRDLPATQ